MSNGRFFIVCLKDMRMAGKSLRRGGCGEVVEVCGGAGDASEGYIFLMVF
jgi:hypothetical protein